MKRVYFLRPVGQLGPVKIGCSKLPELRLEQLTTWSPTRLELICSVPGTHKDERTLHGMFAKHQVHGEWFGASKELLALIDHCQLNGELPELPEVIVFPRVRHVGHKGRAQGGREPGELPPHKLQKASLFRAQHESGMTCKAIADEHGINVVTVRKYIRAIGGTVKWPKKTAAGVADTERAQEFKRRYVAGETLQQIGNDYGLTRERVRQILRKINVESFGLRPEHCRQHHELTPDELLAADLYKGETPPRDIYAQTGIAQHQLYSVLERLGIPIKQQGYWHTRADDAERTARICELYQKGFSAPQIIARIPDLKYAETVYRYLKKGGVPVRNPGMGNFSNHPRTAQGRSA